MNWVLCIDNTGYQASLQTKKSYQRINDPKAEALGMIKVIDESGDGYLYSKHMFVNVSVKCEKYLHNQLQTID